MRHRQSGWWLALVLSFAASTAFAENGVSPTEILIGVSLNVTGQGAARAKGLLDGAETYFRRINAAGGVNGRRIVLKTYDDAYDPARTIANTRSLIEKDHAFALFKYFGTPTIKAVLPAVEREDIPMIAPSSGAESLRNPPVRNVFMTKRGYFDEAERMVKFLAGRGIKKIGIFFQDDSFGNDGRHGVLKVLSQNGLELVGQASYHRKSNDVGAAVAQMKAAAPQAVLLWGLSDSVIEFIKLSVAGGFKPIFITSGTAAVPELATMSRGLAAEIFATALVPLPDGDLPLMVDYRRDFQATGLKPDPTSFEGYLDGAILTEALRRAGKELTRESLRQSYETKLGGVDIGGFKMNYSPTQHQGLDHVYVIQSKDGKFVRMAD